MFARRLLAGQAQACLAATPISRDALILERGFRTSRQLSKTQQAQTETSLQKETSQTIPIKKHTGRVEVDEFRKIDRPLMYHNQMEFLDDRMVRISKPTKNVMQSGTAYTNCWKIEFDSQPRDEYWLMGWTGTGDPMSNWSMTFQTKEAAVDFCEKSRLQWFVEEQPERKIRRKSYADNFSWNKRTRLGSK